MLNSKKSITRTTVRRFFTALGFSLVLGSSLSFAAERDGTALFFSFDDVKEGLRDPAQFSPFSNFAFQTRPEEGGQESPIERNYRWGNGLGFYGYAYPGTRRPLWGY